MDIQSKVAYIYDYFHDDQPELNYGMTYKNTTKTKIDIKFIISEYGSLSKDQPSAKIMFKPSFRPYFNQGDSLYYLEEKRSRLGSEDVLVGCYIDIPDQNGIYHKWMICLQDIQGNQFQKYFVLPCGYNLEWIRTENNKRIKQKMWCVLRSQSSYNSGLWTDYNYTTRENQEILYIPTNSISDTIWYISQDNDQNQRLIVDVPNEHPNVWQVSKVEKINVKGRTKITLYQTEYNEHADYIEKDDNGNIIGMWADYYSSYITPIDEEEDKPILPQITGRISATSNSIKVGGSYKLLTIKYFDSDDNDVTERYSLDKLVWTCYLDGVDITDNTDIITWSPQTDFNKMRIKVANDRKLLTKILIIKCENDDGIIGEIQLEIVI